ncbi:MAG: hypothetical protein ACRDQD_01115 [Nocardioidaceae bacterium]
MSGWTRTDVFDAEYVSIGHMHSGDAYGVIPGEHNIGDANVGLVVNHGQHRVIIEGTPVQILRLVASMLDVATNAAARQR